MAIRQIMFSVFIFALSLGLISSVTTKETVEYLESSGTTESLDRTLSELSAIFVPLISSYLQGSQSAMETSRNINDISVASTIKIIAENQRSIVSTITETLESRSDSLTPLLKSITSAFERFSTEPGLTNTRNSNDRMLDAIKSLFPNANEAIRNGVLSDVLAQLLQSSGIFEPEQFPDSSNNYLDRIRSFVDNRDEYKILPKAVLSNEKYTTNRDPELLYSNQIKSNEVIDIKPFKNEDSKPNPKTPSVSSESIRSKRSTNKRSIGNARPLKSLYSVVLNEMSLSPSLSNGLILLASPESRSGYEKMFSMVESFLGDGSQTPLLNELREAIDSTLNRLKPEDLIEAFSNAVEQVLISANRSENFEEFSKKYVGEIKNALESFDASDDMGTRFNIFGLTIYGFMLNEGLAKIEIFRALMENFTSELYSLSGMRKPNANAPKSDQTESMTSEEYKIPDISNYLHAYNE